MIAPRLCSLPKFYRKRISVEGECWIWTGSLNAGNAIGRGQRSAARQIWEIANGPLPDGYYMALGTCLHRECVRHREPIKAGHHTRQGFERGTIERGAEWRAKLTVAQRKRYGRTIEDARGVRRLVAGGASIREAAAAFGFSVDMGRRIVRGANWIEATDSLSGLVQQMRRASRTTEVSPTARSLT